jgi:hypothetical protein
MNSSLGFKKLVVDGFLTNIPGAGFVMSLIHLSESVLLAPLKAVANTQDVLKYFEDATAKLDRLAELQAEAVISIREEIKRLQQSLLLWV